MTWRRVASGRIRAWIREGEDRPNFEERLCTDPSVLLGEGLLECARRSPSASVYVGRRGWAGEAVYWKEFHPRGALGGLKALVRGSRARREARGARRIEEAGFRAPEILAFGERLSGGLVRGSFVVTAEVGDAASLRDLAARGPMASGLRRRLARALGHEIGRLHRAGLAHGDLRLSNVLASGIDSPGPRFHFLDNERTRRERPGSERLRGRNLVQLSMDRIQGISRTDRIRFAAAYLSERPDLAARRREWLRGCNERILARWRLREDRLASRG